jgi:hypothetical protein
VVTEDDRVIARSARDDGVIGDTNPSSLSPHHPITPSPHHPRWWRLVGAGAALVVILGGCAASPEAARVPGEPGADPGNHGNPVVLVAPPDRFDRVYYDIPYDGPRAASEDTSQS